ncbi:MAG TPA: glycosyltransferase family 4 protein [Candidatus Polarisedimenticolaceae bacterium]|nr:glycosyltransferase family 4 protein [Candidatus Polarisedimenticolaceae bacterium]
MPIDADRPIRLLTFSGLYPSTARPTHGIFVEQRLRQLLDSGRVEARVVAPVPWFPFRHRIFGEYSRIAATPRRATRHGVEVEYARFPVLPKIGAWLTPYLLAAAAAPAIRRIVDRGFDFDVLDAHYFFPDGVAAARIGRRFGKPTVITARGSDVNVLTRFRAPRRMILRAAEQAAAVVTVSDALRQSLEDLGVDPGRLHVLRNGVDLGRFRPVEPRPAGWPWPDGRRTILSVGNLIEGKGHHLVIRALERLDGLRLVVVGAGRMRGELSELVSRLGLSARVHLAGTVDQTELPAYYSTADALVLASRREGMPNVVLEALACGCPVVATAVGGIPEIIAGSSAGMLLADDDPETIAAAVGDLLARPIDRRAIRQFAERFGWEKTVERQIDLFSRIATAQTTVTAIADER